MASYDFVCEDCDERFEVFVQGFLHEEHKRCPKCGSTNVRQKFSSFLSNLGGSGSSCSSGGSSRFT